MSTGDSGAAPSAAPFLNPYDLPPELRALDQWVVWRTEVRDGKPTKVPYQPRMPRRHAKTNDPSTWGSFDDALSTLGALGDGIGFVFDDSDPFCGIDIDECVEARGAMPHPAAWEIIEELDGYVEWSPSGTGLHVIVRARLDGGRHATASTPWDGKLETYDRRRFFTFTGDVLAGCEVIPDRQEQVDRLRADYGLAGERLNAPSPGAMRTHGVVMSDDEVLERARKADNGAKFLRLWAGDATGYDTESEADAGLLGVLAFWTQDVAQLDRLFRRSGRFREKWERGDYRELTLGLVLSSGEAYTGARPAGRAPLAAGNGSVPQWRLPWRTLAEEAADVPEAPSWIVPGYAAPGIEVLLAGAPKAGKSTLLFHWLAGIENGGEIFGLPSRQVTYAFLTEEKGHSLREKMFNFDLRGHGGEVVAYHRGGNLQSWFENVQEAVERCRHMGHELLIVDTLSQWAHIEDENSASEITKAWRAFDTAKELGLATIVVHHARKGGGRHGEGIRGSNQIAALPDILLELRHADGEERNARVLTSHSRFEETPEELGLIYQGDGYEATRDVRSLRRRPASETQIIEALRAHGPMTTEQICEYVQVAAPTVKPRLKSMFDDGVLTRSGTGGRNDAYVYAVATR